MPKMTKKYSSAVQVAGHLLDLLPGDNQEELYRALNEKGYFWNSETGKWEFTAAMAADEPTKFIRVRVWAETFTVLDAANQVAQAMQSKGYELQERSDAYVCRPPKQKESRVYLTFLPIK